MAGKSKAFSDAKFAKMIKEGRGSGEYSGYKPWLTVRDLPSLRRVHRIFGHKSKRTHHLLSDLDFSVFLRLNGIVKLRKSASSSPLQEMTRASSRLKPEFSIRI
ncbi:hypothetical protein [Pseudovibrio sp. Ad37]|uniref:hypothetical protein n=1 Tax=Pseudovibrio sp. Ad37 TaxID=989422 RepID=UPI0007AEC7FE|nr:hypothetical protein [Pseudovibrio sp. Ad37]KZL21102.1 Transposon Tn7 transposition protein TnsA [Pseudovibrio sp. Ad37]